MEQDQKDPREAVAEQFNAAYWNAGYLGLAQSPTFRRVQREVYGDKYPEEIAPFSCLAVSPAPSCTALHASWAWARSTASSIWPAAAGSRVRWSHECRRPVGRSRHTRRAAGSCAHSPAGLALHLHDLGLRRQSTR